VSLLERDSIDAAIGLFKNEEDEYHAMVFVHMEDLGGYGCLYYKGFNKPWTSKRQIDNN